ncbi:hypothetical protein B0H11DRAFT_113155 [Mycena galericulata]|nr:hypothetical protein B0H11DRAFT_113155 [Mycena galericulata]
MNLNFHTGTSTSLFTSVYRGVRMGYRGFVEATIVENMACIRWKDGRSLFYCILLDWKRMLRLKLVGEHGLSVNLIPNHVLVMTAEPSETPEIRIFDTARFSRHWGHTTDASELNAIPIRELDTAIDEKIVFARSHLRKMATELELCTYESPVEEGTYRVWAYLRRFSLGRRGPVAVACSCTLRLPNRTRDGILWSRRTTHTADHMPVGYRDGISYSGHKLGYYGKNNEIFRAISHPGNPSQGVGLTLPIPAPYPCPYISAYSGAVTYLANGLPVVIYFE